MENSAYTEEPIAKGTATGDEFVSGFALSGDYIKTLTDKSFTITAQRTELVPSIDNKAVKVKKLILTVKLADGTVIDYMPNMTSQKFVIGKVGYRLDAWVGFKGEFITFSQLVGNKQREVIYINGAI